jgi:hypothetical protein
MKSLLQPINIRVRTTISALRAAKGSLLESRANILDQIRFLFNNVISETGAY